MSYPDARRDDLVEDLLGHRVADPYRWLEDPGAPETVEWSAAQDSLCSSYLERVDSRPALRDRLRRLVPAVTGPPVVAGGRSFWTHREAAQDHPVLLVGEGETGPAGGRGRVLVDPNALAPDGTTTLDGWSPSLEGDRVAYLLSEGGAEESRMWVVDVATGAVVEGPVGRLRYSPLAWLPGGEALLYVRRLAPSEVPAGEEAFHRRLWLHRVGTDPDTDDVLLFGEGIDKTAYLGVDVSADGRWAAVTVSLGTAPRNDLHVAALPAALPAPGRPAGLEWRPVTVGLDAQSGPHLDNRGRLWLLTDLGAPRRRLCVCDPADPAPARWREVIGEDPEAVLEDFALTADEVVVLRSRHALSEVAVHDRGSGEALRAVGLPGPGSADLTGRRDEAGPVWVGFTDWVTPYRALALDPATGALASRAPAGAEAGSAGAPPGNGNGNGNGNGVPSGGPGPLGEGIRSAQLTCESADGTVVRVSVIAPAAGPDRARPAVLYGYGGFDVAMTPAYSSSVLAWVAAGGVWAVANLRGGSEEGEQWHRAGMRQDKQRVFEDFEAAADLLVAGGWTTPGQLGIMGGSNGGLLVGAALTRDPARYAAVVCSAPLLDMVRYERFGLGATWNDEYGRADDAEELGWLLGYSPYHHVSEGLAYPAVLFTVFDSDTRVDPLHARKMAAALQHATTSDPEARPILLRRESDVGHGARAVGRSVDLAADQLAFLGRQLGMRLP